MQTEDMKLYFINFSVILVSFADIEFFLKIILLLVSIMYTIIKLINLIKEKREDKRNKNGIE